MVDFNIVENIANFFKIILSSNVILFSTLISFILCILFIILIIFKYKPYSISFLIYLAIVAITFFIYFFKYIISTLDSLVTIFIKNLLFPSIYIYIGIIILSFIIIFVILLNKDNAINIKIINFIYFTLLLPLFILFFSMTIQNSNLGINMYKETSNLAVLQLTTFIFSLWILTIIAIKIYQFIISEINKNK